MHLKPAAMEKDEVSSLCSAPEGKTTDPEFVPKLFTRKSRTVSRLFDISRERRNTFTHVAQSLPSDDGEEARLIAEAKDRLYCSITGRPSVTKTYQASWDWYCGYLDRHASLVWHSLIAVVLTGVSEGEGLRSNGNRSVLYYALAIVAQGLFEDGDITLPGMIQQLRSSNLLREDVEDTAVHMVFQMTGWLCALWDPLPTTHGTHLRLSRKSATTRRRRSGNVRNVAFPVADAGFQSVRRIAHRFGNLLPEPEPGIDNESWLTRDLEVAWINTAYMSFQSLESLVNVTIEWTKTLAQHLEYDSRRKTLYVFQHPSICLMMCREEGETLLTRIYDCERLEADEQGQQNMATRADFESFLVEVIQSYRIIFASDSKSRRSIATHLDSQFSDTGNNGVCDPLLRLLCVADENSEDLRLLFEELDIGHFDHYMAIYEFPFLANKLLNLQRISKWHSPYTLRRLWNDRRNPMAWFALWAFFIIGLSTLIFQILQFVFQIYQPFGN